MHFHFKCHSIGSLSDTECFPPHNLGGRVISLIFFTATVFQHASMLECSCHIISYLADVMNALRQSSGQGSSALLMDGEEKALEVDSDWVEELAVEDDDSQAEDSVRIHHF